MDSTGISFTALYTGHTWYRQGWADAYMTSQKGRLLYHALSPLNHLMERVAGFNIESVLLARHRAIDLRLQELIEQGKITQVIEIAAGLSPRGQQFARRYPQLNYVEADLPKMASRKQKLLRQHRALGANHRVVDCDIFSDDSGLSLAHLFTQCIDSTQPTLVITEGLVNYFTVTAISDFWRRLGRQLKTLPAGYYLTDLMIKPQPFPMKTMVQTAAKGLGLLTRSEVSFHFSTVAQIMAHFEGLGYARCLPFKPQDLQPPGGDITASTGAILLVEAKA